MATLPALPAPTVNHATLVCWHSAGAASALVAMLRPGGAA